MMTFKTVNRCLLAISATVLPAKAFAFDWSACNKEIKANCQPSDKSDKEIFDCLEKVEKKLAKPCYDAHEKYENEAGMKDTDKDKDQVKDKDSSAK